MSRLDPPILVIDHEDASPPGLLGRWLDARGHSWVMPPRHDVPTGARDWRAIVSLGWEESSNADRPEVDAEVALLRQAVADDVPVLGLCFGSQTLARALGGRVEPRWPGEFGWVYPVGAGTTPITVMPWFCWHEDAVELPSTVEVLATTGLCVQAYRAGRHVGFQFHPEVDAATIERWMLAREAGNFAPADLTAISQQSAVLLPELEARAFALFDWWASVALAR